MGEIRGSGWETMGRCNGRCTLVGFCCLQLVRRGAVRAHQHAGLCFVRNVGCHRYPLCLGGDLAWGCFAATQKKKKKTKEKKKKK